jgi:hypothetical protein
MSPDEESAFEKSLSADPQAMRQVELQRAIDRQLRQMFPPPAASALEIKRLILGAEIPDVQTASSWSRLPRHSWLIVAGGLAAVIACDLLGWHSLRHRPLEPYFRPSPLADIYRQTVESGFRPYYLCEDEDRFQLTFEKRQSVPLQLAQMPADRRMVGLSYLGGLSRNTTAILCHTTAKPVVVFVDRLDNDTSIASDNSDPRLHIFRRQLGGLVAYEVTPLESATIIDYLEVASREP